MSHPALLPTELPEVWALCVQCFHGRSYIGPTMKCEAITSRGFCGAPLKRLKDPMPEREFMRLTREQRQDLKLAAEKTKSPKTAPDYGRLPVLA